MKEITIKELAYLIKQAKQNDQPQPIFFLGAGASASGNIPLAGKIVENILIEYSDNPFIIKLDDKDRSYSKLMECLLPHQRNELLKKYIDEAKINVTHIYLAQLLKNGFVDYVLTVNFDNLMLRALALYNIFPSTYDMAILKDLTTTTFKEKSVVYLHGQHHGLWLLNTEDEMDKVKATVPRIFDSIKNKRPWIFIGYSGSDPIFHHIKKLGRFDNGLYWIGYNNHSPNEAVHELLNTPNTNAFFIKGYDSDAFMLKLNEELGLGQPQILNEPFSSLKEMLNEINDINDEEHFKGVRERLEIAKKNVAKSINQFEKGKIDYASEDELRIDALKKEIIQLIISEEYDEKLISELENKSLEIGDERINNLLSGLYSDWGGSLDDLAKTKEGKAAEELYEQAFDKYQKSIEIKPDQHQAFYNWGNGLGDLAKTKEGKAAEELYEQAFDKFQKSIEIKPDQHQAFYNWGTDLGDLAKTKEGKAAEELYEQAFDKFQKSIEIKPDMHQAFYNWGTYLLGYLAKTKEGKAAEELYEQAFDKFQKSIEIKPDQHETFFNWGVSLGYLAKTKEGKAAEELYEQAFDKFQKSIEIKPDMHQAFFNWGVSLGYLAKRKEGKAAEELYEQVIDKYQKSIEIKPDQHQAFFNWGNGLGDLAKTKEGKAAEELYEQAFDKYQKSIEIKPDMHQAFFNWGNGLDDLAKTKEGKAAEELYEQAFDKYQKSIEIKPDMHQAFYNWGNGLGHLAKTKEGKAAEELYEQAIGKYHQEIKYGGRSYNLSCIYAIKKDKKNALLYLNQCLSNSEIKVEFVEKDEDWATFYSDKDFLEILDKYRA